MKYCVFRNSIKKVQNPNGSYSTIPDTEGKLLLCSFDSKSEADAAAARLNSDLDPANSKVKIMRYNGYVTDYTCTDSSSSIANKDYNIKASVSECNDMEFYSNWRIYSDFNNTAKGLRDVYFDEKALSGSSIQLNNCPGVRNLKIPCGMEFTELFMNMHQAPNLDTCEFQIDIDKPVSAYSITHFIGVKKIDFIGNSTSIEEYNISSFINLYDTRRTGSLTTVRMPDHIKELRCSFKNCWYLADINIPSALEVIGDNFLLDTSVNINTLPNTVTTIGDYFMNGTSITSFTFPDSVTTIGDYPFRECENLEFIEFGRGLTNIGVYQGSYNNQNIIRFKYLIFHSPVPNGLSFKGQIIYVDDFLVNEWKTNSDNIIRPLSTLTQ